MVFHPYRLWTDIGGMFLMRRWLGPMWLRVGVGGRRIAWCIRSFWGRGPSRLSAGLGGSRRLRGFCGCRSGRSAAAGCLRCLLIAAASWSFTLCSLTIGTYDYHLYYFVIYTVNRLSTISSFYFLFWAVYTFCWTGIFVESTFLRFMNFYYLLAFLRFWENYYRFFLKSSPS